jgi:anthranilate phosphoribosyltransferase
LVISGFCALCGFCGKSSFSYFFRHFDLSRQKHLNSMTHHLDWNSILGLVSSGESLTLEQSTAAIQSIMSGDVADAEIALLLTALHENGETAAEIAGAAIAMRANMLAINTGREILLDTCGTGGDGARTFNISTATAIVVASAGVPVAKHGNRSITSKSGSSDVLAALGVNIHANLATVERCIRELGIGFCFAPLFHPAMQRVGAVRRSLPFPTIFNLLGPLSNPAGAPFQLLGVGKPKLRPLLASALKLLGSRRSAVVSGDDGLDEVTLATTTRVTLVENEKLTELAWSPEDFGLQRAPLDSMLIEGPEESAAMIRKVFANEASPARDIVILNAAAALWLAGKATDLKECAKLARDAITNGAAAKLLEKLAAMSHGK